MINKEILTKTSFYIAIFLSLFITYGSIIEPPAEEGDGEKMSKIEYNKHIVAYFILTSSWFIYFNLSNKKNPFAKALVVAFWLGFCLELTQAFIPYRTFQLIDITDNFIGGIASYIITPSKKYLEKIKWKIINKKLKFLMINYFNFFKLFTFFIS